jgi:hypothetical protein
VLLLSMQCFVVTLTGGWPPCCCCLQGPRRTTITCPEGDTASIKLASYGGGLTNQDVTDTMAEGCSESSCIIDMDELPEPAGKTLRVEYACACGAGKKAQRDASTRECELCPAGQARMPAQPDCQVCAEGTYQDEAGQVGSRVTCPLHTQYSAPTNRQAPSNMGPILLLRRRSTPSRVSCMCN